MDANQRFLNVGDAAAYLGVSAASLRKWSDDGLVHVYRTPGGQRRYYPEDLDAFLASMRQPQAPQAVPRYGRAPEHHASPAEPSTAADETASQKVRGGRRGRRAA